MGIITRNVEDEFNKFKKYGNKPQTGVTMGRSAILDKSDLPPRIQRKMASPSVSYTTNNNKLGNPSFYHPLFQETNMMLPRDRRERNEWCRHFYRTEPIVGSAIDLHTEYPISNFNHICSDKSIKQFFDYMSFDRLNIIDLLLHIGQEYWKVGDVFPFGKLNEEEGIWDRFKILNPDYINIKTNVFADEPMIELIPDEDIRQIVSNGSKGETSPLYNQFPDDIIRDVKQGKNIQLDNRLISHIAHKASDYEIWGTPILMRCFKTLIYKDQLRQAQQSIAGHHIFPLRVAKVGAPGEPMPQQGEIDALRDSLIDLENDPNNFLVYWYGLQLDYVGSNSSMLPLAPEFEFIKTELLEGLGISEPLLDGEAPNYSSVSMALDSINKKYLSYRLRLENWIKEKVYKPIAKIQGFYKPIQSELNGGYRIANRKDKQLIIPEIKWESDIISADQNKCQFVTSLFEKNLISTETMMSIIGLNSENEKECLIKERGSILDPNAPSTGPLVNQQTNLPSQNGEPNNNINSPGQNNIPTNPPSNTNET